MAKSDYCVFIGRFQPFHNGHLKVCENALKEAEKLIVVVGSYRSPTTVKNPWSFEERKEMILASLDKERVIVLPARDYLYSDLTWLTGIQNTVASVVKGGSVKLTGHFKDDSSYYLKLFPQWEFQPEPNYGGINGTDIRESIYDSDYEAVVPLVPQQVELFLNEWYYNSSASGELIQEYNFLNGYKKLWEDAPFPPVFVTTDAVLVQAGHVLLIKRGRNPGKGCYALPGGFLGPKENILDSCLRELKEETCIVFPKEEIKKALKGVHVFDHPNRDPRGRTITHAHFFHLTTLGPLPAVEGGDDANEAVWVPLNDLTSLEDKFFSDHLHIIQHFITPGI